MACCPYAICTFAGPAVLAAPTLIGKFRRLSPSAKAGVLVVLPLLLAGAAAGAGTIDVAEIVDCLGCCDKTRNMVIGGLVVYGLVVQKVSSSSAAPASCCPVSGKGASDGACAAAAKKAEKAPH